MNAIRPSFTLGFVLLAAAACTANVTNTSSPTVSAIALSPSPCTVGHTDSTQMSAEATLPDGTKQSITSEANWSTGNSNTITVNSDGTIVGVNPGATSVTAEYQGATGTIDCTVTP